MSKNYVLKAVLVVIAALAPFTFANEPLPPPYHQYILSGRVIRTSNGPKAFFDSLALKVAAPDKPVVLGGFFGIPDVGVATTGTFGETEPGCSGCSKDPATTTRIIGYTYTLRDKSIVIP